MTVIVDGKKFDRAYCAVDFEDTWQKRGFLYVPLVAQRCKATQRVLLFMSTELAGRIHTANREILGPCKVERLPMRGTYPRK